MKAFYTGLMLGLALACYGNATSPTIAQAMPVVLTQNSEPLQGRWELSEWGTPDSLTPIGGNSKITAEFDATKMSGSAGCNRYTTSYQTQDKTLIIGAIASTKRACASEISEKESQYLNVLGKAKTYAVTAQGKLQISYQTDTCEGILVFVRQTDSAPQADAASQATPASRPIPALW
jgi:heat shock protein HslJ